MNNDIDDKNTHTKTGFSTYNVVSIDAGTNISISNINAMDREVNSNIKNINI